MSLEQEIRDQIERNKELKQEVGYINTKLSVLEGLCRKNKDDAYKKGYDAGIIACSFVDKSDETYQRGLEDAWEAAKKIVVDTDHGGFASGTLCEIFGTRGYSYIMQENTAQEAIDKIKSYEDKQKEDDFINVGDEVVLDGTTTKVIITGFTENGRGTGFTARGLWVAGDKEEFHKTGRHFDIQSILEAMKDG